MPHPKRSPEVLYSDAHASLLIIRGFAPHSWFLTLQQNVQWRQNTIRVFGKEHFEPRLTAWYGPPYRYSSIQWEGASIPEFLLPLVQEVNEASDFQFNSVLLNHYRDGNDSMGWHSDNEVEIDQRCIASLSFGATRNFDVRNKLTGQKMRIALEDGSLLLMNNFQDQWQHAVPKTKKCSEGRINLTFRYTSGPL